VDVGAFLRGREDCRRQGKKKVNSSRRNNQHKAEKGGEKKAKGGKGVKKKVVCRSGVGPKKKQRDEGEDTLMWVREVDAPWVKTWLRWGLKGEGNVLPRIKGKGGLEKNKRREFL